MLKHLLYFFITLILIASLASCEYGKPILTIPDGSIIAVDSSSHAKIKKKSFYYFSLRAGVHIAYGSVTKIYSAKGILLQKEIYKRPFYRVHDGYNSRQYVKTITYDSLGHKLHCDQHISWGVAWQLPKQKGFPYICINLFSHD